MTDDYAEGRKDERESMFAAMHAGDKAWADYLAERVAAPLVGDGELPVQPGKWVGATPSALPVVHSAGDATALKKGPPEGHSGYVARPDGKDQSPRPEPLAVSEGELPARPTVEGLMTLVEAVQAAGVRRGREGKAPSDYEPDMSAVYDYAWRLAAPQGQPAPDLAGVLEALILGRDHAKWSFDRSKDLKERRINERDLDQIDAAITALRATEGGKTQ